MFFSIIVPVYNAQDYIADLIETVLQQSFTDWELILVNDGSTDTSREVLKKYAQADARVRHIDQPNGGVSSARNCGIKVAQGEYLLFADADDTYQAGALEFLAVNLTEWPVDLLAFGYEEQRYAGGELYQKAVHHYSEQQYSSQAMIRQQGLAIIDTDLFCAVWSKAYRGDLIRANQLLMDEQLFLGEDYCFNLSVLEHCQSFRTVAKPLYCYKVQNEESLIRKYHPDKFVQMYRMHQIRSSYLIRNKDISELERKCSIRMNYVRICISCFMDFTRKDCPLNFKEQYRFVKTKLKAESEPFSWAYVKLLPRTKKVIYLIFSSGSPLLLLGFSRVAFWLKFRLRQQV